MPAITFLHNFAARMLPPFVPHPTSGVISFPVAKFHANTPRDFNDRATENLNIFHPSISLVFPPDLKPPTFCHAIEILSFSPRPSRIDWMDHRARSKSPYRCIQILFRRARRFSASSCAAILRREGKKEGRGEGGREREEECNIAKSVHFAVKPKREVSRGPLLWFGRKGRGESSVSIDTNFRGRGDFFLQLLSPRSALPYACSYSPRNHTLQPGEKRITKGILCLRSRHPPRPRAHRDFSTKSFETFSLFHKRCKHALSDQYLSVIYNYFKRFDCAE